MTARCIVDAVDDEVERSRGSQVREDGIERRFHPEQCDRGETNSTALKPRMMSPTRRRSPRRLISSAAISVPSSTAPPRIGEADARPEEEPAKHRRQHEIGRDIRERDEGERAGKAGDAEYAS